MGKEELDPQFVNQIDNMEIDLMNMQNDLQKIHHIGFDGLTNDDDEIKVILDILDITRKYLVK